MRTAKFWYYEKPHYPEWGGLGWTVWDEDGEHQAACANEQDAFQIVRDHNTDVSTSFEKAKLAGRAPGAI